MVKQSRPVVYRISPEVEESLRKQAKKIGGIDNALRALLFGQEIKPGSFALLGRKKHKCQIRAAYFEVTMLEDREESLTVIASVNDLTPYEPTEAELLKWKLTK